MKTSTNLLFTILLICLTSCNYFSAKPECNNMDKFFDENDPMTEEYQLKVIEVLKLNSPVDFRYFFKTFSGESNEFLIVNMRNDEYCFDAKILVKNWGKLAGMREKNGQSYPEKLYNLDWSLEKPNEDEILVYVDMNTIID